MKIILGILLTSAIGMIAYQQFKIMELTQESIILQKEVEKWGEFEKKITKWTDSFEEKSNKNEKESVNVDSTLGTMKVDGDKVNIKSPLGEVKVDGDKVEITSPFGSLKADKDGVDIKL